MEEMSKAFGLSEEIYPNWETITGWEEIRASWVNILAHVTRKCKVRAGHFAPPVLAKNSVCVARFLYMSEYLSEHTSNAHPSQRDLDPHR